MVNEESIESNEATAHAAAKLATPAAAKNFMLAGKAIFTLVSMKTGTRYTYKVTHKPANEKYGESWMVSYLTGPDNWANYSYIGQIKNGTFRTTAASKLTMASAPVAGFNWAFTRISDWPGNTEHGSLARWQVRTLWPSLDCARINFIWFWS